MKKYPKKHHQEKPTQKHKRILKKKKKKNIIWRCESRISSSANQQVNNMQTHINHGINPAEWLTFHTCDNNRNLEK